MKIFSCTFFLLCAAFVPAHVLAAEPPARGNGSAAFSAGAIPLLGETLLLVETTVDGVPAKLLLDTGASHTSLDAAWAKATFPAMKTRVVPLESDDVYTFASPEIALARIGEFRLGGRRFTDVEMPLADLSGLRRALPELNDVVGILGMNATTLAPCRISFGGRRMEWVEPGSAAFAGKEKFPVRRTAGTDCVQVTLPPQKPGGSAVSALIDSGAVGSSVPADFWIGAAEEKRTALVTTATGTRKVAVEFGVPATLKFSETLAVPDVSPRLIRPGEAMKILLGLDVLNRLEIIFDLRNGVVWIGRDE